jgi:hypothetical protein
MGIFVRKMGYLYHLCCVIKKQNHENTIVIKTHREKNYHIDVFQRCIRSY